MFSSKLRRGGACSAFGCTMRRGTNLLSQVKMYKFPTDPVRRKLWEIAVKRANFTATKHSQLCNLHFCTGRPSKDPMHPDYVPSIFCFTKKSFSAIDRYNRHAKRLKSNPTLSTVCVNGLKRQNLKKNAVPSCNLPTSTENGDEIKNNLRLQKARKTVNNNYKIPMNKKMSQVRKSESLSEKSSYIIINDVEEGKNERPSSDTYETNKQHIVSSSFVAELSVMTPNYSTVNVNVAKQNSEELDMGSQNSRIPLSLVKYKENSEFDCSKYTLSPDDSREILTKKLEAVLSINARLQKRITLYQNRCQMYEKEVNIMKGVIDSLRQINSVTYDN